MSIKNMIIFKPATIFETPKILEIFEKPPIVAKQTEPAPTPTKYVDPQIEQKL